MKTYLELIDNSKIINMIQVMDDGTKKEKTITVEDLAASFTSSIEGKSFVDIKSDIFREVKGCRLIQTKIIGPKAKIYALLSTKSRIPMQLFNRFYDNVGIPNLIYAIHVVNNRLTKIYVVATKDTDIKKSTELFIYPFTNVSGRKGQACLGRNSFAPGIEDNDCEELYNVHRQFMSMPNNLDYYRATNNTKCYECEELIKSLVNVDFDDDMLVSHQLTYGEWFCNL